MRWFKHLSTARNDEDMAELLDTFGPDAYGVWWIIVEIIAEQMDKTDKCFARFSIKKWSNSCRISPKKFQNFVEFLSKLGKLSFEICEKNKEFMVISIPNILKFRDEYSKKSGQTPDNIRTNSGVTPDSTRARATETETETETETNNTYPKSFEKLFYDYKNKTGDDSSKSQTLTNWRSTKKDKTINLTTEQIYKACINSACQKEFEAKKKNQEKPYYYKLSNLLSKQKYRGDLPDLLNWVQPEIDLNSLPKSKNELFVEQELKRIDEKYGFNN